MLIDALVNLKKIYFLNFFSVQWKCGSFNINAANCIAPYAQFDCLKTRKTASTLYAVSVVLYLIGGWFAFVQPWLSADV